MENKKIILSDEIAKLAIDRRVTISDLDNAKNPVCIFALNAKNYQILSCLLISCISANKIKKFDDLTALRILLTEVKQLHDTPDYRQADFLTSQGDNRHCISSIEYAEQLLEQILADNIAW